ncbi:MAG: heparin lyase I family protein [Saccharospirillum sp.]|uniref:heparin lyase I family protein n=1 Tax=Saccharospirillum sp. TaxID=2033801 RepID=UPI003299616A
MKELVFLLTVLIPVSSFSMEFSDSFETDTPGGRPDADSSSVFNWTDSSSARVSNDRAYTGQNSMSFTFEGNIDTSKDSFSEQRFSFDKKYSELWIRYKMWVPENYVHRNPDGASNNKGLINLWGGSYSGYTPAVSLHFERKSTGESYLYSAWRANGTATFNFYDPNNLTPNSGLSNAPVGISFADRGTWIDWVINVKTSTVPIAMSDWKSGQGNGVVRVWKNGSLILNIFNAHNYYGGSSNDAGGSGDGWNAGYLLGWANSGFDEDTNIYIDDFLIGSTNEAVDFELNQPVLENVIKIIN